MSRVLLVDTNRASYPIYESLRKQGHEVWVVGAKPDEPLAKLAAHYVQLDYSDTDKLATLVDERDFDFLIPGCTDLSYEVCAEINNGRFLGIDTLANTHTINAKHAFRKVAAELDLPVPRVLSIEDALEADSVIVKPVDAFSGRGIRVAQKPDLEKLNEVIHTASEASRTSKVILEEFIVGQLYSHSAFVRDGRVVADFVVQENCTVNPFTVDTSRLANAFSDAIQSSLRENITRLCSSLSLVDGLLHTQFIVRGDNYWIIEMTRRCPGDIYSMLIEFSTGYSYAESYVAPFIGNSAQAPDSEASCQRIIRHTVTSKKRAPLWGFRFSCPTEICLFVPLATAGDIIDPSPYGRAGIFFLRTNSMQDQETLYQKLLAGELCTLV